MLAAGSPGVALWTAESAACVARDLTMLARARRGTTSRSQAVCNQGCHWLPGQAVESVCLFRSLTSLAWAGAVSAFLAAGFCALAALLAVQARVPACVLPDPDIP